MSDNYSLALLVGLSLILSVQRVRGEKGSTFQAISHIYVGALLGAWLVLWGRDLPDRNRYLWLALFLSAVEVLSFAAGWIRTRKLENSTP